MTFFVKEIKDKKNWEDFLFSVEEKTFLQSWNWAEFSQMMGDKIWRLGIYQGEEKNELAGVAQVIKIKAKRGTFLFLPHAPAIKNQDLDFKTKVLETLLKELREVAKKEKVDFIRIAPIWQRNEENKKIFENFGFKNSPIHIHPEVTWELDIALPEEELLQKMRKTTRYLIRQALKEKDIEIIKSQKIEDIEKFNELYQKTVDRHHFVPFSTDYLKKEFSAFNPENQILIFLGKYKGELVSSGIFLFWQNMAFYHHGASSLRYSKVPVSYLLQWEAIKEAKKRNCLNYNFWGIVDTQLDIQDPKYKKHPWAGLSLFKMGFGGQKKEYLKTQDLPLSKKYWIAYLVEKIRKARRGL